METDNTLFRSIVESTSDVLLVLDERAHIRYAGRASLPSTGYLPAELETQALPMFIHPSDVERVSAALRAARTAPDPLALIECRFRRKDGSWRVFELRVDGLRGLSMAQHVLVICRDVTARSRAARQLRFAQSLQRSQNAATQDALLVLSAEGDVLQCNPRFLQLWGIDSSTVLLRCDADVWRRVLVEIEEPKVFLQMLATIGADPARVHTSNLRTRAGAVICGASGSSLHGGAQRVSISEHWSGKACHCCGRQRNPGPTCASRSIKKRLAYRRTRSRFSARCCTSC
jgi:PAS domain S-box-containing protein